MWSECCEACLNEEQMHRVVEPVGSLSRATFTLRVLCKMYRPFEGEKTWYT